MKQADVAVVLNVFARPQNLTHQITALRGQSVRVSSIHVWANGAEVPGEDLARVDNVVHSAVNLGVWARFSYALNLQTEFVLLLDDDTVPGSRWIENCLNTMKLREGLLGTRGLRFRSSEAYRPHVQIGWQSQNENVEQVHIVGHSWFARREWLGAFWSNIPDGASDRLVGEDINFSYAIQKEFGLNTYVPPHPPGQMELWGSLPEFGATIGGDENAISSRTDASHRFQKMFQIYVKSGFLLDRYEDRYDTGESRLFLLALNFRGMRRLVRRFPVLKRIGVKIAYCLERMRVRNPRDGL